MRNFHRDGCGFAKLPETMFQRSTDQQSAAIGRRWREPSHSGANGRRTITTGQRRCGFNTAANIVLPAPDQSHQQQWQQQQQQQ